MIVTDFPQKRAEVHDRVIGLLQSWAHINKMAKQKLWLSERNNKVVEESVLLRSLLRASLYMTQAVIVSPLRVTEPSVCR